MKCYCGVELFDCDIVKNKFNRKNELSALIFRCPRCYSITEKEIDD